MKSKSDFLIKFLEIGRNNQGQKYAHVFPWGRKHIFRVILSQLRQFVNNFDYKYCIYTKK